MPTSQALLTTLDSIPDLRPFPAVASRLMAEADNQDNSPADLSRLVSSDPIVTARLLRMANSSMFGFPGEVRSIDQAIVLLGRRQLKNLAVSFAANDLFSAGATCKRARVHLWDHSLGCASVARALARHTRCIAPDEAFLAGILHDVGKLVLYDVFSENYIQSTHEADFQKIIEIESSQYGLTHQEIGNRCADEWGLPYEMNDAIGSHHVDASWQPPSACSAVVAAANLLARSWNFGGNWNVDTEITEQLQRCDLDLQLDHLPDLKIEIQVEFDAIRQVFG